MLGDVGDVDDVGDDDDDDRSERHSLVRPCVVCMRRRRFVGPHFTDQPSGYPRNGMPGFRCESVQGRIGSHSERTGEEGRWGTTPKPLHPGREHSTWSSGFGQDLGLSATQRAVSNSNWSSPEGGNGTRPGRYDERHR